MDTKEKKSLLAAEQDRLGLAFICYIDHAAQHHHLTWPNGIDTHQWKHSAMLCNDQRIRANPTNDMIQNVSPGSQISSPRGVVL